MLTQDRNQSCGPTRRAGFGVMLVMLGVGLTGCASVPKMTFSAERHRLEVDLDVVGHGITAYSALDLSRTDDAKLAADRPAALEVALHPDLRITQARASGARIVRRYTRKAAEPTEDEPLPLAHHGFVLDRPTDSLTLFISYKGKLFQDVAAGEVAGQIHNFDMHAHIGEEGIYLASGCWYPTPTAEDEKAESLTDFTLVVQPVPGMVLKPAAEYDSSLSDETGALAWRSPYPIAGLALVGGPHEVYHDTYGDVRLSVHLKPSQSHHAKGLLGAVKRILGRYEQLIGPYPAHEFAIVDNFFSSGFAFPTFTLLSSAVIEMGKRSQTAHGYLDHEILHSWWGNGIFVDPHDGNWCEALASYAANYYGYVLDGNPEEARRKRRNYAHFLSRIKPEKDKPLGTYGLEDGCGRGIAYQKGAMVFHMLARTIGQENFWAAMRRFTAEYVGRHASWEDIRRLCEAESGRSLDTFFRQWVRSGGAPSPSIEFAGYHSGEQVLTLELSQGEPAFDLDLPVRVTHAAGTVDITVPLSTPSDTVTVPLDVAPVTVELDPDYHIFRKVPPDEITPTTATTRHGDAFACVLPAGEAAKPYESVKSIFDSSFEEKDRIALTAGKIEEGALAERCVLILGDAVRDPHVAAFLSAIEFPVTWTEDGFEVHRTTSQGETTVDAFNEAGDAVLCTAWHPGVTGGGVSVVFGNSKEALPKAMNLPFYDRSLIVFKDGRPVLRYDLEKRHIIPVSRL